MCLRKLNQISKGLVTKKEYSRQVINIRTDLGWELAKSSKFYDLLVKEYQCGLQTTGGYSSW